MNRRLSLLTLQIVALITFLVTQYPPQSMCEYTFAACVARNHTRWVLSSLTLRTEDDLPITFEVRRNSKVLLLRPDVTAVDAWMKSESITPKVLVGGAFIAALVGLLASFLVHHVLKAFGKE